MIMSKLKNVSCALMVLSLLVAVRTLQAAEVQHLRCEYLVNPLGIDALKPRLSWEIGERAEGGNLKPERGIKQIAYQVLVASSEELLNKDKGDLWDSGKVESDQQNQLEYAGKPLESRMRCYWKVRVWEGRAEGGNLKPENGDGGKLTKAVCSKWSKPAFWTMGLFKQEDPSSPGYAEASWQAKWIGLENGECDTSSTKLIPGKLVIRKAIYSGEDKSKARDVTEILAGLVTNGMLSVTINNKNLNADIENNVRQTLHVEYEFNGQHFTKDCAGDYVLGDLYLPEGTTYFDTREGAADRKRWPVPRMLRKEFKVVKNLRRATVYVTALGLYELRINGERVGDHILAPEWTSYDKRVQYQTFDVTAQIKSGGNAVAVVLGNGWYCGGWSFWGKELRPMYGKDPNLLLQLEIENTDGSRQVIASDTSWRGTTDGPIRFSSIYEGEIQDARMDMPGWDSADFNDAAWKPAQERIPGTDFKVGKVVWQRGDPIRKTQEITPVNISEPKPGVYVVDMGQNFTGWARLRVDAAAGTRLTLQHGEILNNDGTVYLNNLFAGHFGKGDRQIERYVCRGGYTVFEPHFTYHGFRYVQIHGLSKKPSREDVTGIVFHTGFRKTGEFTCSNPLVNRLVENIQWSQRSNIMGIPTDCPQRDERCGYTGDINFFMPAAVYNFDMASFFNKWLVDVEQCQNPGGWYSDHAPFYGMGGGPNVGWSDAGVMVPYAVYKEYGDTRMIRENYAGMKRFMDYLDKTTNPDGTRGPVKGGKDDGIDHIGHTDHINLGGGVSKIVCGTTFHANDAKIMAEMAEAIGKLEDAAVFRRQAERSASAFAGILIDADGRVKDSSQCGYALALTMGLVPAELKAKVGARFMDEIKRHNGHVTTGFMGTGRILPALQLIGQDDAAYKLLLNETYPSWLYMIKNGATTMWENWGGITEKGLGHPDMNSFNHFALGAVGGYLFSGIGGISPEKPGYQKIRIQPVIRHGISFANTSYESIRGRIATAWKVHGNKLTLDVTIPANTTATVYVPVTDQSKVTESGKPANQAEGVKFLRREGDAAIFEVGSGSYSFQSTLSPELCYGVISQGKTVTMSEQEVPGWETKNAVDGNINSGWSSGVPKDGKAPWIMIDLDGVFDLSKVGICPRIVGDAIGYNFPVDFEISISMDGQSFSPVLKRTDYKVNSSRKDSKGLEVFAVDEKGPANNIQYFVLPEGTQGRYLKIAGNKLKDEMRMQFTEIEVFGGK
jgi:alpha-L-rhamnosidase